MRTILNVSLPEELLSEIDSALGEKESVYSTRSEFVRELITDWFNNREIYKKLEKSKRELKAGDIKRLSSLADLD